MTNDPDDKDNDVDKVQQAHCQGVTAKEDIEWVALTSMYRLRMTRIKKTRCSTTSTTGVKD